ncbi:MAG: MotA/TolQ/ExbB proton channel family protein [Planctomycetia bacterium]|nr:MotA/TolQ/ExbB proton channel family protein [Planctomycetia bacterium]
MSLTTLTDILGTLIYISLAGVAIWGAYCVIVTWRRAARVRFRSEQEQDEFLDEIEQPLLAGDFEKVAELCENDVRALPQLILLAVENRELGFAKVRGMMIERFQRDVLSDLEFRLSWVNSVIKAAPMLGLFGTVTGMMGAFDQLANPADGASSVDPGAMAGNISVALITTACGLAIAIPLIIACTNINVRIRKMEDLMASGTARFLELYRQVVTKK